MTIELDKRGPATNARTKLPAPGRQEPWRDGHGKYRILCPEKGELRSYTRATTVAGTLEDTITLHEWEIRMTMLGLMQRDDLQQLIIGADVDDDRKQLNEVAGKAKDAAKADEKANLGTALHRFTELWDAGAQQIDEYPERFQPHLLAYAALFEGSGLEVVEELTEAVVFHDGWKVAGTIDRVCRATKRLRITLGDGSVVQLNKGDLLIVDLKTGKLREYNFIDFATQITLYATHQGRWVVDHEHKHGGTRQPRTEVDQRVALICHLPASDEAPKASFHALDLTRGYEYLETALAVRGLRSAPVKRQLIRPWREGDAVKPVAAVKVITRDEVLARLEHVSKYPKAFDLLMRRWPWRAADGTPDKLPDPLSADDCDALLAIVSDVSAQLELPL